jgi:hypothetical protein
MNRFNKPYASFNYKSIPYDLKITDPIFIEKLKKNNNFHLECLLTISMGAPYQAPCDNKPYCYKMVAGVIEL